jgi:hypothetical protein
MSNSSRKARRAKAKRQGDTPLTLKKVWDGLQSCSKGIQEALGRVQQLREEVEPEMEAYHNRIETLETVVQILADKAGVEWPSDEIVEGLIENSKEEEDADR